MAGRGKGGAIRNQAGSCAAHREVHPLRSGVEHDRSLIDQPAAFEQSYGPAHRMVVQVRNADADRKESVLASACGVVTSVTATL